MQCTVQCALKVAITSEDYWEAMAEWVMFDAAFSDVCGIPCADLFRFQRLMLFFGEKVGFKWRLYLEKRLVCVEHKENEMHTFSSTF